MNVTLVLLFLNQANESALCTSDKNIIIFAACIIWEFKSNFLAARGFIGHHIFNPVKKKSRYNFEIPAI